MPLTPVQANPDETKIHPDLFMQDGNLRVMEETLKHN